MANIIPFDKARHREAQLNLPWYVAGELEGAELARFEAHLAGCLECQAEVAFEKRMRAEYADAPLEVEHDWAKLQGRLGNQETQRGRLGAVKDWLGADGVRRLVGQRWLSIAVAAQALLIIALVVLGRPADNPAFRALSDGTAVPAANIVVMFRPDATEQDLRAALTASDARMVDGPLAAGGYLLRASAETRDAALTALRSSPAVASAEPIDAEAPR